MKRILLLIILAIVGCNRHDSTGTLSQARKGFHTKLVRREIAQEPVPEPPPQVFRTVHYSSAAGLLSAYLTPDPMDDAKHPAIVWITGGDCNTIGDVWTDAPASNDQTAKAYRSAGIVMMFPSLRGGNDNPGVKEGFLGEVDDVIAAADYLANQSYVDPKRIYLGGHSTGGTLVLLVAECTDRFRAIFSFGPANDVRGYGPELLPFNTSDADEAELRSPGNWIASIQSPTFVFEGTAQGNIEALQAMASSSTNRQVQFIAVPGMTHFTILAPANRIIADKILRDEGATCNVAIAAEDLGAAAAK